MDGEIVDHQVDGSSEWISISFAISINAFQTPRPASPHDLEAKPPAEKRNTIASGCKELEGFVSLAKKLKKIA